MLAIKMFVVSYLFSCIFLQCLNASPDQVVGVVALEESQKEGKNMNSEEIKAYREKYKAQIEQYRAQLDQLRAALKEKTAEQRIQMQKSMDDLEKQVNEAEEHIKELDKDTSTWEKVKEKSNHLMDNIKSGFKKMMP